MACVLSRLYYNKMMMMMMMKWKPLGSLGY